MPKTSAGFAHCSGPNLPVFHGTIASGISILSPGSPWGTQTAASWAKLAVEALPNGQAFIIPEAGHGATAYRECARALSLQVGSPEGEEIAPGSICSIDMGIAFIDNPTRKMDNRCRESARPEFYAAPWVGK